MSSGNRSVKGVFCWEDVCATDHTHNNNEQVKDCNKTTLALGEIELGKEQAKARQFEALAEITRNTSVRVTEKGSERSSYPAVK